MSLTSSLFSGISGMANLGNAMQIIGDNIANVNTVGFKGSNFIFQDLLSQSVATQSGTSQVGRGMAMGDIAANFVQGSFESTGNTTDLAIGGDGFFVLRDKGSRQNFYTRAGNFRFDKTGQLINAEGHIVQGWKLDENGDDIGSVIDILMSSFTSPPESTGHMTVITNLDSESLSKSSVLQNGYDSTADYPLDGANYEYQTVVKVYDSLGSTHDITIYYDKKSTDSSVWEYLLTCNPDEDLRNLVQGTEGRGLLAKGTITFNENSGNISNITMSRFTGRMGNIATSGTIDPDELNFTINNYDIFTDDGHGFDLEYATDPLTGVTAWSVNDNAGYANAAVLAATSTDSVINIDFSGNGESDLTIYLEVPAQPSDTISFDINNPDNLQVQNMTNIAYTGDAAGDNTTLTIDNPDALAADNTGIQLVWTPGSPGSWSWGTPPSATEYAGATFSGNSEKLTVDMDGDGKTDATFEFDTPLVNASTIDFDVVGTTAWTALNVNDNGYYEFTADFIGGSNGATELNVEFDIGSKNDGTGSYVNDSLTTTQFSEASSTTFQSADGYGAGDLQSVDVGVDGVITGVYSNGQLIPLYRVALAKFLNNNGLYKVGGNLYRETRDSGAPVTNKPGTNGLGSISPNSLEQSNVDLAKEFVTMITTQRGFQANSKIVTTIDQMLGDTINMKR